MSTWFQDARYGLRALARNPWFAFTAIVTLALGIGANTAIFSVIDAILIRSLPFPDANRLVWITSQRIRPASPTDASRRRSQSDAQTLPGNRALALRELRLYSRSFSDVAAYNAYFQYFTYNLTGSGDPERLSAVDVTDNFFSLLGVTPLLGRTFLPEECQRSARRAV